MNLLLIIVIVFFVWKKIYDNSEFYQRTKASVRELITSKRRRFQYKVYCYMKRHHASGKLLIDVNLESTWDVIDVVYVAQSGIYLWNFDEHQKEIYGDFASERWLQKVPGILKKSAFHFFDSPVARMKESAKDVLKRIEEEVPIYSYIMFSKDAKFKQIFQNQEFFKVFKENAIEIVLDKILKDKTEVISVSRMNNYAQKLMGISKKSIEAKSNTKTRVRRPVITFDYFPSNQTNWKLLSEEEIAGKLGEHICYSIIKNYEKMGCKILRNLYLPKYNGETTEIDMLMISTKGIFVFECKNYKGWIFGNAGRKYWYQTLPKGYRGNHESNKFYNPIFQNNSHIRALKNILKGNFTYYSMIAFSDSCTFKSIPQTFDNTRITKFHEIRSILEVMFYRKDEMNEEQVLAIYKCLYPYTIVDEETKRKHVEKIEERYGG